MTNTTTTTVTGAGEFALYARLLMKSGGDLPEASNATILDRSPRVRNILKAAASAGTTTDSTWASGLTDYKQVAEGFITSLRQHSVFDRLLADGLRRVPLRTRIVATTAAITGATVAEGAIKPVSELALVGNQLEPVKAAAIVVLSDELVRSSSPAASAFLSRELRQAVAKTTDTAFLAGISSGVTPTPSAGATAVNVLEDIDDLLTAVTVNAESVLFLVYSPAVAKKLATKINTDGSRAFPEMTPTGGEIAGITVLVSDALAAGQALLIDASGIAADSDTVVLDASETATIEMDTAPTGGAASTMTSLWQQNLKALRAERYFGFEKLQAGAVAALSGVAY